MSFNNLDNRHFNGKEKNVDWMHFEIAKQTTRLKNAKILHDYA